MENENITNNKAFFMVIFFISLSSFCAFLIGYGMNSGSCPVCKNKTIVKLFTTVNNVVNDVDYNMLTSEIKKDLVGKYVNQIDSKAYLEIFKDGSFEFIRNSCNKYEKFTNEDYVLLIYYSKEQVILEETEEVYETILTLIPKKEIKTDNLIDSMLTFRNAPNVENEVIDSFVGPVTCSTSNLYIKKEGEVWKMKES